MAKFLNKDWCSFFFEYVFNVYIGKICYRHDMRYSDHTKSRWVSDKELLQDVYSTLKDNNVNVITGTLVAILMWTAVRLVGWKWY